MRRLLLIPLAILLVCALVLGGCGQKTATVTNTATSTVSSTATVSSTSTVTNTATSTVTSTATVTASPTAAQKSGGTLKIYYSGEPSNIGKPTLDDNWGSMMQLCAVECLAREDNNGILHPWLAESWEGDSKAATLTVKLRSGVKFQDGTDCDAEAVKWNWDQFTAAKMIETQSVTSIVVVDKYTIQANLKTWDNSIYLKLLLVAGKIVSPAAYQKNGDNAPNIAVGTGPFKFVYWTPNVGAKFVKWDGYRLASEGKPYLDAIEFKYIADATAAKTSFMNGDLDVMHNVDAATAKSFEGNKQYVIMNDDSGVDSFFLHIFFDLGTAENPTIFNDINIRKAVAYCIDNQALVDGVMFGYAITTNQWGAPTNWAHNPNVVGYPQNIAKAKECLAKTQYPNGFSTKLYYWTGQEPLMLAIQQMLAEANIKVEIVAQEGLASYQYIIHGGWNGLLISPKRPDGNVPYRMQVYLGTGAIEGVGLYHSADLDAKFVDALSTSDFDTQRAKAWALQKYLYDDLCVAVPLYVQSNICIKYPYVKDDGFGTTGASYWAPESAWKDK
jgi:peptide/nickel transport system substrate-binding protein